MLQNKNYVIWIEDDHWENGNILSDNTIRTLDLNNY